MKSVELFEKRTWATFFKKSNKMFGLSITLSAVAFVKFYVDSVTKLMAKKSNYKSF